MEPLVSMMTISTTDDAAMAGPPPIERTVITASTTSAPAARYSFWNTSTLNVLIDSSEGGTAPRPRPQKVATATVMLSWPPCSFANATSERTLSIVFPGPRSARSASNDAVSGT